MKIRLESPQETPYKSQIFQTSKPKQQKHGKETIEPTKAKTRET